MSVRVKGSRRPEPAQHRDNLSPRPEISQHLSSTEVIVDESTVMFHTTPVGCSMPEMRLLSGSDQRQGSRHRKLQPAHGQFRGV